MQLHSLIQEFSKIKYSVIGKGPKHPDSPDINGEQELTQFLKDFPAFANDIPMIEFFEYYGTVEIFVPETPYADFELIMYGFDEEISMSLAHPDESLEENGFYRFAEVIVRKDDGDHVSANYAMNVDISRKQGIYYRVSSIATDSRTIPYRYHCSSFLEWLENIITHRGKDL